MGSLEHTNKHIQSAIQHAQSKGWRLVKTGKSSHAWGRLLCPETNRNGCQISIWSTPRNPKSHAKQILRAIKNCEHGSLDDEKL